MLNLLALICLATTPRTVLLDRDWQFHRENQPREVATTPYVGPDWENVNLPHAARLEDDTAPSFHSFQGVVWYKKVLHRRPDWAGKRVALRFDGAMQVADVWLNGEHKLRHTGGYLPFDVDLTDAPGDGGDITVLVRLDNRDNPAFPPGRPQNDLDFTYAGGLYRDVWLEVTNKSHIANVYVMPRSVTHAGADVAVQVSLENSRPGQTVVVRLLDPNSVEVGRAEIPASSVTTAHIHLVRPALWDLDRPNLYHAVTRLRSRRRTVDEVTTRFGVRNFDFDHHTGFKINGKPLRLEGSNRHMAFPIVGNAMSDAAQYREAKRLKGLGLNILRLAHYPQTPAFLDACDELGILVIDPIPGWQFFSDTPEFKEHVFQDVRETVVRDRNHPSVAIFETCLNETYGAPDEFWLQCHRVAHQTFGEGNFFTGGDAYGKRDYSRPIWDVPWTGWTHHPFGRPALFKMQKGIDREYGDYEFGGEESTSRVGRGGGEGALMIQAWNFIWSHNRNRKNSWSFGDLTWEAIDTYRGMNPSAPVSQSGLLDLFRLPKPIAYFFQSQGLQTPMVHIANRWSPRPSPTKVVVFSNCDEVAILVNGKQVARQRPDSGPTTGYISSKVADPLYWAHGKGEIVPAVNTNEVMGGPEGALPFSGGNCEYLSHPPFTFDGVKYVSGRVEAVGYRHGRAVARDVVYTPGKPTHAVVRVDTQGRSLEADDTDFVFAYVELRDRNEQVVPDDSRTVRLTVHGAGAVLGSPVRHAAAGIAPFMVRSKGALGGITLEARADGLPLAVTSFRSVSSSRQ